MQATGSSTSSTSALPQGEDDGSRRTRSFTTSAMEAARQSSLRDISAEIQLRTSRPSGNFFKISEAIRRGLHNHISASILTHRCIPTQLTSLIDQYKGRVYGGRFVSDSAFITSCQDRYIRIYNPNNWKVTQRIPCNDIRWTITDFDSTKDALIYSTINQFAHYVSLSTGFQRTLSAIDYNAHMEATEQFGVMACMFLNDSKNVVLGCTGSYATRHGTVRVVDTERNMLTTHIKAHREDVNGVSQIHEDNHSLILSASDDGTAKLWDLRTQCKHYAGIFIGHVEGLTHISSKNDSTYFITQGKDQTIKLWDTRNMETRHDVPAVPKHTNWDYRYQTHPGKSKKQEHFRDDAIMTYSGGHETCQTLIRSYFSPLHSTGQRYIYTGGSGKFTIYDVLTGDIVVEKHAHQAPVRDVSWHPHHPILTTVGWDHNVFLWKTNRYNPFSTDPENSRSLSSPHSQCPRIKLAHG